ncbi:MAG: dihydroorotate dehydrogenase electron transfer subunit [Acidobacteria bacterium]|nr:dihydroorotate dehydrogenase electron transfer subunit [Acidobacteriota bacterium]
MPVDVEARVIRNTRLSSDYNVIALAAPDIAAATAPGQFVMVKLGRGSTPLLRRPFSVFEVLRTNGHIEGLTLLSKRVGVTTQMLFDAVEGDVVSCLGPLGKPYTPVDPPTEAWMVAGGVGLAPFATLTEVLRAGGTSVTLFYGARTDRDLFYLDWFRDRGVRLVLATEDGSLGDHGRITKPLERELHKGAGGLQPSGAAAGDVMIYACGPEPMLEAVAHVAARYERPCEVSVERVMGCGLGGCYSCVIPVRDGPMGHHYVRSCLGGPVFAADQIAWEAH